MKISIDGVSQNYRVFLQRLGYSEHRYRGQTEPNFTRRLGPQRFPRVHVYVRPLGERLQLNMHVDMQESTASGSRHGGIYDHELLAAEAERIKKVAALQKNETRDEERQPAGEEKKKSLFRKLFG